MTEQEPNTIEGLVSRYEQLSTDTTVARFSTGPDESAAIAELWDNEVERTRQAFRFTQWTLSTCLNVRMSMLLTHDQNGNTLHKDGSPDGSTTSDDYLTQLFFEDRQVLVSMANLRDTSNFQVVHIARFPLTPGVKRDLRSLVDFDNHFRQKQPEAL